MKKIILIVLITALPVFFLQNGKSAGKTGGIGSDGGIRLQEDYSAEKEEMDHSPHTGVYDKNYKIGGKGPGDGWIFYDKGVKSDGWRYLEAASEDQSSGAEWGCQKKSIKEAMSTDIGAGRKNSLAIVKACKEDGIAAKLCLSYKGGDKDDWFLPSLDELDLMNKNLHKAGIGGFKTEGYWSSSQYVKYDAWFEFFGEGSQYGYNKGDLFRVRAIRAF